VSNLFQEAQAIINVGLASFADSIGRAGGKAVQVEWSPPARGDRTAGWNLAQLVNHPAVESANQSAYASYLAAQPVLSGVGGARAEVPGLSERMILHAGPPIAWNEMCGPMQAAVIGAILFEGWAADGAAARRMADSGEIAFAPAHHHAAVGPMARVISPSMPVGSSRTRREATARSQYERRAGEGAALRGQLAGGDQAPALMADVLAPAIQPH
jgi:hypothetical protein